MQTRAPLLSALSVTTIAFSLFAFGLFSLVALNIRNTLRDVESRVEIRAFLAEYNRRHGATVLLTSHYMADVEALCRRVIVIHQGRLLYDGDLTGLVQRFAAHKTITVELEEGAQVAGSLAAELVNGAEMEPTATGFTVRVPKTETPAVSSRLLAALPIADLTIEEPPVDQVIEAVFAAPTSEADRDG